MSSGRGSRLDSWKAIAKYLDRSVRTVRRWEADEDLPVHRLMHKSQGSVYAYPAELDAWRTRRQSTSPGEPDRPASPSIAVLPFAFNGPADGASYLADGFTEEIIDSLSRLDSLRVIARTSVTPFRSSGEGVAAIARKLSVGMLLEGTVRQAGDAIRVSVRLVDVSTQAARWSSQFDGTLDDIFGIQSAIARNIVDELRISLDEKAADRIDVAPASTPFIWECLVHARQLAYRWQKPMIDEALLILARGRSVAGDDPRLCAAEGRVWLQYREAGIDMSEVPLERAGECLQRARRTGPSLPATHELQGWIAYATGDIVGAIGALRQALEGDANNPETLGLLINCLLISGQVSRARPLIASLVSIDPLTPLTRCLPGWADLLAGDAAAAVGPYRQMFEMDEQNPVARLFYVFVLASNGDSRAAEVAAAQQYPHTVPGEITRLYECALTGKEVDGVISVETEALACRSEMFARFIAQGYALAGAEGEALRWLRTSIDRGFANYPYLAEHDPLLAELRRSGACTPILAEARRRFELVTASLQD